MGDDAGQNLDFIADAIDFENEDDAVATFGDVGDCAFYIINHRFNNTPLLAFIKLGDRAENFVGTDLGSIVLGSILLTTIHSSMILLDRSADRRHFYLFGCGCFSP